MKRLSGLEILSVGDIKNFGEQKNVTALLLEGEGAKKVPLQAFGLFTT